MKYLYGFLVIFIGLSVTYDVIYTFFLREPFGDFPKWAPTSFCLSMACCLIVWTVRWVVWNKEPWK